MSAVWILALRFIAPARYDANVYEWSVIRFQRLRVSAGKLQTESLRLILVPKSYFKYPLFPP